MLAGNLSIVLRKSSYGYQQHFVKKKFLMSWFQNVWNTLSCRGVC